MVSRLVMFAGGPKAVHIVPCPDMRDQLRHSYRGIGRIDLVSVGASQDDIGRPRWRQRLRMVGFLANVNMEKRIHEYLDTMARFSGAQAERTLKAGLDELDNVVAVGPVHSDSKAGFLDRMDLLLFPSHYPHETDPTVIHEAFASDAPVIAWQRGCISHWLAADYGLIVPPDEDFVKKSSEQIVLWLQNSSLFQIASAAALASHRKHQHAERRKVVALAEELCRPDRCRPGH